jgi:hypothetical protein
MTRCARLPVGRRAPLGSSTNGSRIQVPIFSRATTFDSANVAAMIGTISRPVIGSLRALSRVEKRTVATSAP